MQKIEVEFFVNNSGKGRKRITNLIQTFCICMYVCMNIRRRRRHASSFNVLLTTPYLYHSTFSIILQCVLQWIVTLCFFVKWESIDPILFFGHWGYSPKLTVYFHEIPKKKRPAVNKIYNLQQMEISFLMLDCII